MSQDFEDFELEGFDLGTGLEDSELSDEINFESSESSDGFVPDDGYGFNFEEAPKEEVKKESGKEFKKELNLGQISTQQKAIQKVKKEQRVKASTKQNVRPNNQVQPKRVNHDNSTETKTQSSKKKKSKFLPILAGVGFLTIGIIVGVSINKKDEAPQICDYNTSGKVAYDNLITALNNYDAITIDSAVGLLDGDSYLAQEWSYANNNEVRQRFISVICSSLRFSYPQIEQLSTSGKPITNDDGTPVLVDSQMNNNEEVTVTCVDYKALSTVMQGDKELILNSYINSRISPKDYNYNDEMVDLMLSYILSKSDLPTTQTNLSLGVSLGETAVITDDVALDKLLFSSEDFHNMCDTFAQVATGFTGYKTEKYIEKEEQENPEYKQWKMKFDAYFEADNGKFKKGVSKWEPWYKRDDNNNYILDKKGKRIVNYYSIKDKQGNDWIQPSKKIIVDVEKTRKVSISWEKDSMIPYCFLGAYYCQNEYTGNFSPDVRIGDGTIEHPAGVGTPIITKCLGADGKYHDVKVTLIGYWVGQDAIDYAVSFSEKNRGFDVNSVVQLICYEVKIENLEDNEFSFESEMYLSDKNSNKSNRTGTMYMFKSDATVKTGESVIINDWATSTELAQKYVTWGSSFNRVYNTVYFRVLAGDGEVPTYSAYKAFTGDSKVSN